jgi:hypothetical protein
VISKTYNPEIHPMLLMYVAATIVVED